MSTWTAAELEDVINSPEESLRMGLGIFHNKTFPNHLVEGAKWIKRSAELGLPYAQAFLGVLYAEGLGVPMSKRKAFDWNRKAAIQGNSTAMGWLGCAYLNGSGVLKNREEGIKWLKKSAAAGNVMSAQVLRSI